MTAAAKTLPKSPQAELLSPAQGKLRRAASVSVLSAALWPVQAALVATALAAAVTGDALSPWGAMAGFAALGLARAALTYWAEAFAQDAAEAVTLTLRHKIVRHEAQRAQDCVRAGAGAIAALASEKLDLLTPFLTRYALARARATVLPVLILALAFWHSWAVGVILLIAGPLIPVFMALIGLAAKEASARQMTEIGTLNDLLVERLSALIDIRLLGAQDRVVAGFSQQAGTLRERTMAVLRVAFLSSTVLELFAAIGVAMVAVYVGFSLLGAISFGAWGGALTPWAGIFLLLLAPDFFQPLRDLSAAWHDKAAADAVLDELVEYSAEPFETLPGTGAPAQKLTGPATIMLSGCVTPSGHPLPLITIRAGERVALTGPSGSGKTSALRLMAGLSVPQQGRVIVAGQRLDADIADGWRARLGWMPQAVQMLTGSLRHNVTLGRTGDLDHSLQAASVAHVVSGLPRGAATLLGETGGGLSGGEARRITLARALHGAPDVILADEPTADLDAATARLVSDALLAQAAHGATVVVATHDPALAARMDRIIDLGAGT